MSRKQKLLDYLYRTDFAPGRIYWEDVCIPFMAAATGELELDLSNELTPADIKSYWQDLLTQLDEDTARGLTPLLHVPDRNLRQFFWYPSIAAPVNERVAQLLRLRSLLLREIDALSWRRFEALACVASECLGAPEIHLTASGNEGGIDFLARFTLRTDCHIFCSGNSGLRIVGQCKNWNKPIEPNDIRSFSQTIQDVRHDEEDVRDIVPTWFKLSGGPLAGWVVCRREFTDGVKAKAYRQGMILSDSLDIAEILAKSRKFRRLPIAQVSAMLSASIDEMLLRFP